MAASDEPLSPRSSGGKTQHPRESPRMTPQMLTLGRDARDDFLLAAADNAAADTPHSQPPKPWWKKNPFESKKEQIEEPLTPTTSAAIYSSLEEKKPTVEMEEQRHRRFGGKKNGANYASVANGDDIETDSKPPAKARGQQLLHAANSLEIPDCSTDDRKFPPSTEDQLQQDCNFFYREMDEQKSPRKGWRARVVLRDQLRQEATFEYSQAVTVLSPPVLQRFRTRYAQLNQEIQPREDDFDLRLAEEGNHMPTTRSRSSQHNAILRTDTVEASSLFYQQNGKMFMRLPRDQVRLLMEPDLDPGVLSVEQCRQNDNKPGGTMDSPPLRYVLTVDDDLYRMIFSEMSDNLTEPFCGLRGCCLDDKKVDIRVALTLLIIILIVIFMTTEKWPTE